MPDESPHERIVQDYRDLFGTEVGQRVLAHICEMGHVMAISHKPGDTHETAYREGERGLALAILRVLDQDAPKLSEALARRKALLKDYQPKEPA